jgi:hypothetical protein
MQEWQLVADSERLKENGLSGVVCIPYAAGEICDRMGGNLHIQNE